MKRISIITAIILVALTINTNSLFSAKQGDMAIGGQLGLHIPSSGENGLGLLASFEYMATPDIAITGRIGYTSWFTEKVGLSEYSLSEIPIKGGVKYFFPMQGNIKLFGGAELGLHMFSASVSYPGFSSSTSNTELGLSLMGGTHMPLSPQIDFYGDLKYSFVSDLKYFSISAGILYKLPQSK